MTNSRHPAGRFGPALVLLLCCCPAGWLRGAAEVVRDGQKVALKNGEISTTFDLESGAWQAADGTGAVFAKDLKCSVDADGKTSTVDPGTDDAPVSRRVKRMTGRDAYGQGVRLVIEQDGPRTFALIFTMYDAGPFFLVQLALPKSRGVKVSEITLPEGNLLVGKDVNDVATLVNYWNGNGYSEIHPVVVTDKAPRWETHSHYCLAAHNRGDGRSVVLGSLYPKMHCDISAAVDSAKDPQAISFAARLRYDKVPLAIDEDNWQTQPVFVCAPTTPKNVFDGLETYGAVVKANKKMRPVPPPTGWCSRGAGRRPTRRRSSRTSTP